MERDDGQLEANADDEHREARQEPGALGVARGGPPRGHLGEIHRSQLGVDQGHAEQEEGGGGRGEDQVLDAGLDSAPLGAHVGDQGIERHAQDFETEEEGGEVRARHEHGRARRRRSPLPIADCRLKSKIGNRKSEIPAQVEEQQGPRQDEHEHGRDKEVHVGEEAAVAFLRPHVLGGVQVDEKAHHRHDHDHHQRHRVQVERDPGGEARDAHPRPERLRAVVVRWRRGEAAVALAEAHERGGADRAAADDGHRSPRKPRAEEREHQKTRQRQRRNQPQ